MGETTTLVTTGDPTVTGKNQVLGWAGLAALIAVSSLALSAIGSPAPSMFGGLLGALVFALLRPGRIALPPTVSTAGMALIGCSIATDIDPHGFTELGPHWPVIGGVVVSSILVSITVGQLLRLHGVSFSTACFASIAGGASGMTALAQELGADTRVVVVAQYLRVLAVLLTLPAVVALVFHPATSKGLGPASAQVTLAAYVFALLAVGLTFVSRRFARVRLPAVLGGMLAGFLLMVVPTFRHAPMPPLLGNFAFMLVGVQAGLKFTYESVREMLRMLPTIFLMLGLLVAACGGLGMILARETGENPLDCYLATSPGGVPVALATVSGTSGNVTLVSTAQVLRILVVVVFAPLVASLWTRRLRR